jgi:hypothetical protein
MPTLADIYSTIDSYKRKLGDVVGNPIGSLQQAYGNANDKARDFNELTYQASLEKGYGPKNQELARQLAEAYSPAGMTVWHGSPFKFKAFDPIKIGTGEGAQAFGHGLYVAENPKVAEDYMKIEPAGGVASPRRMLLGKEVEAGTPEYKVAQLVDELGLSKARKFILDWSKKPNPDQIDYVNKASDIIQNVSKKSDVKNLGTGNLYKIDLPDEHINKMLDWDKPLEKQPKNVQEALAKHNPEMYDPKSEDYDPSERGQWTYMRLANELTQKNASNKLSELGVPGLKYLDEGSRAMGEGTRNFVLFPGNEHLLNIQDMNGNPLQ